MQKSNFCLTCKKYEIKNEMKCSILALIWSYPLNDLPKHVKNIEPKFKSVYIVWSMQKYYIKENFLPAVGWNAIQFLIENVDWVIFLRKYFRL